MPDLETRALLILMADQRRFMPLALSSAMDGGAELRRLAALSLARLGDPRGLPLLESLLGDADEEVRRAAAFALGEMAELGVKNAAGALLGATQDPNRDVGAAAVEGLAKAGVPLEDVVAALLAASPDELLPRLVPSLYRFRSPSVVGWAEQGLDLEDPRLRALAAYGLAREPQPGGVPALRKLLEDKDPWIRGWGARALGRVGDRSDMARLLPLLADPDPGPIVQALRAGRRLVASGKTPPPEDWRPRLLELMDDPRSGVRLTAIEAATAWLLDAELGGRLERLVGEGNERERELAVLSLAEAGDPRLAALLPALADGESAVLRSVVAQAAALVGPAEILSRLAVDPAARVRRATLEALLALAGPGKDEQDEATSLAVAALDDQDSGVRSAVLGWAAENPRLPGEILVAAFERARRDREPDARLAAVRALGARAEFEANELEPAVAVLERLAEDDDYLVRRTAAEQLVRLGEPPPALGPIETGRRAAIYREIAFQTSGPVHARLITERGEVGVELACREAPLHCLNFLQLASQGFYDGLRFHRVVPDFVVQGGDPRGDGLGGPGYTLRDEPNLLRYDAGVLGMARGGPDTAGSQFFITLSRQPHLEGAYTAFGRVNSGFDVLGTLVQGDRLTKVDVRLPVGSAGAAHAQPR